MLRQGDTRVLGLEPRPLADQHPQRLVCQAKARPTVHGRAELVRRADHVAFAVLNLTSYWLGSSG